MRQKYIFRIIRENDYFTVQYNKRFLYIFRLGWEDVNSHGTMRSAISCAENINKRWNNKPEVLLNIP